MMDWAWDIFVGDDWEGLIFWVPAVLYIFLA